MASDNLQNEKEQDFFDLIEKEERIENPFADDEVLFKDASGAIRVIKGPTTEILEQPRAQISASPVSAVKTVKLAKPLELNQEIEAVVKLSGIHFNDSEMEKRFKQLVQSNLRNVRNQLETREAFMDAIATGGMGFDAEHTDRIMKILIQQRKNFNDKLRQTVSHQPFADLQAEAEALLTGAVPAVPTIKEKPVLVFKPAPVVKVIPEVKSAPVVKPKPIPTPAVVVKPASMARVVVRTDDSKPKIEDVKFKPKLTGPIEEIRSMSLADFRRLGGTPDQAIERIIEKVQVLEEESFTKKTQAITAWKDSPVNKLYLELGDESIEQKIPIAEVIVRRQQNSQPYLSEEEVDAVIQLNRRLRY